MRKTGAAKEILSGSARMAKIVEPKNVSEALQHPLWQQAMQDEYESLIGLRTWDLCALPPDRNAIGSRWIFKVKTDSDGNLDKFKARLVAQGYSQQPGLDYDETYSPVAKQSSMKILLSLANHFGYLVHQMAVKTAFLNGELKEELYMK